jgi:hypothetical protein
MLIVSGTTPRRGTEYAPGPLGVALCVVDLVDIREARPEDIDGACCEPSPGEFAWILENTRPFESFAMKGRLSIWTPSEDILRRVKELLKRRAA